MPPLTHNQRLFVFYYLGVAKGNGTEAARMAGYSRPSEMSSRLVRKKQVRAAIDAKLKSAAMSADEVLARLSEIASGTAEIIKVDESTGQPSFDFRKAKRLKKLGLIKSIVPVKDGIKVEILSQLDALNMLARYHGLFKDRVTITDDSDDDTDRIIVPETDERYAKKPGRRKGGRQAPSADGSGDVSS